MSLHQGRHGAGEIRPAVVHPRRRRALEGSRSSVGPSGRPPGYEERPDRIVRDVALPALWGASGTLAAIAVAALVVAGPGEPGAWLAAPPWGLGPSFDRPVDPGGDAPSDTGITQAGRPLTSDAGLGWKRLGGWDDVRWGAAGLATPWATEEAGDQGAAISGTGSGAPVGGRSASPTTAASYEQAEIAPAAPAAAGAGGTSGSPAPDGAPPPPVTDTSGGEGTAEPPVADQPPSPSPAGEVVEPVTAAAGPVEEYVGEAVTGTAGSVKEAVEAAVDPVTEGAENAVVDPVTEALEPVTQAVEAVPELLDAPGVSVGQTVGSLPVGLPD